MNGRTFRISIYAFVLFFVASGSVVLGQHLTSRIEGDRLRVSAPRLHFLAGRALERLHNGASVTYQMELTLRSEAAGRVLSRVVQRFTFSYDLWEEKFAVTSLGALTRSASNLSLSNAESWCLENLSLPISAIAEDRRLWLRLDYELEDPRKSESDFTLSGLIDIFSRRSREEQVHDFDEVGPFTLSDLRKK